VITDSTKHCGRETAHHHCCQADWRSCTFVTTVEMERVIEDVLQMLETAGFSDRERFAVRLALEEAVMNAIRHGHQFDRSKHVHLRYHVTQECLLAEVEDEGPGFDPAVVPDPREPENLEREGGRGLLLMRSYMTWVRYNERGTCVTMCKSHGAA
jgi:serine/threonine-protein kinase RsbW